MGTLLRRDCAKLPFCLAALGAGSLGAALQVKPARIPPGLAKRGLYAAAILGDSLRDGILKLDKAGIDAWAKKFAGAGLPELTAGVIQEVKNWLQRDRKDAYVSRGLRDYSDPCPDPPCPEFVRDVIDVVRKHGAKKGG